MACRHLWTAWTMMREVFGNDVTQLVLVRRCVLCGRTEDSRGHPVEQVA